MRFGWSQHLAVAQALEAADPADRGTALALMGVALLMLAQDLVVLDANVTVAVD
jgi:hypothetical protein